MERANGAGKTTTNTLPSLKRCARLACLVPLLFQLSACGYADYSVRKQNFMSDSASPENRSLGNVYLNLSQSETAKPYTVDFARVKTSRNFGGSNKGYAMLAPVYANKDDKMKIHYTVSKTKDYKWFSGLQMRWEF
jgi:hypothetical protein